MRGHSGGAGRRAAAPSLREQSAEVVCPCDQGFDGRCSSLGAPLNTPRGAGGNAWGEGSLGLTAQAAATRPRIK